MPRSLVRARLLGRRPFSLYGACYNYWAYAALIFLEKRAHWFARVFRAGLSAFTGYCDHCGAYAALIFLEKRAHWFARSYWAESTHTVRQHIPR